MPNAAPPPSFIDTSVLVRYLTGDPPEMAAQAARIIDSGVQVTLTDTVLVETAYVLTTVYRFPRHAVVNALIELVRKRNVALFGLDLSTVIDGLLLCRPSGRVSFADAMIWAAARTAGARIVYSFDARFPSAGVDVRRAPPS